MRAPGTATPELRDADPVRLPPLDERLEGALPAEPSRHTVPNRVHQHLRGRGPTARLPGHQPHWSGLGDPVRRWPQLGGIQRGPVVSRRRHRVPARRPVRGGQGPAMAELRGRLRAVDGGDAAPLGHDRQGVRPAARPARGQARRIREGPRHSRPGPGDDAISRQRHLLDRRYRSVRLRASRGRGRPAAPGALRAPERVVRSGAGAARLFRGDARLCDRPVLGAPSWLDPRPRGVGGLYTPAEGIMCAPEKDRYSNLALLLLCICE